MISNRKFKKLIRKIEKETGGQMSYFKDAKVGDKVWDYVYGEGLIVGFDSENYLSMFCSFAKVGYNDILYHKSGHLDKEFTIFNQRLFYYDNRPIVITQDDLHLGVVDIWGLDQKGLYSLYGDYTKYTRRVRRETPEETEETLCCQYMHHKKEQLDLRDLAHRISKLERRLEDDKFVDGKLETPYGTLILLGSKESQKMINKAFDKE